MKPPYKVIQKVIPDIHANFLFEYQNIRYEATKHLYDNNLIERHPIHGDFGADYLSKDKSFWIYGDPAFDIVLMRHLELVSKESGLDLIPMVSYARLYEKGDELIRHKDRPWDRTITATIHIGHEGEEKDTWPLYVRSPEGELAEVHLNIGDMLIYVGDLEHWRDPCKYDYYGQLMLHYATKGNLTPEGKPVPFLDGRINIGMPPPWLNEEKGGN